MLSLIVAIASDGAIGRKGTLPWHISDDLKHFNPMPGVEVENWIVRAPEV